MPKIFLTAIFLTLSILGFLFLVLPKYQELNVLRAEQKRQQIEIEEIEGYFSDLRQVSQQLAQYQTALDKIDMALPKDPEVARLLNFLAQNVEKKGLFLTEIGTITTFQEEQRGVEQEPVVSIKATRFPLRLSGTYSSFKNFLGLLEKSARLIEIERVSFSPIKAGLFHFDLELKVRSY